MNFDAIDPSNPGSTILSCKVRIGGMGSLAVTIDFTSITDAARYLK